MGKEQIRSFDCEPSKSKHPLILRFFDALGVLHQVEVPVRAKSSPSN